MDGNAASREPQLGCSSRPGEGTHRLGHEALAKMVWPKVPYGAIKAELSKVANRFRLLVL
jgi:hypothetical protein